MRFCRLIIVPAVLSVSALGHADESEARTALPKSQARTIVFVAGCVPTERTAPLLSALEEALSEGLWTLRVSDAPCPPSAVDTASESLIEPSGEVLLWIDATERMLHLYFPYLDAAPSVTRPIGDPADPAWPDTVAMIARATVKTAEDEAVRDEETTAAADAVTNEEAVDAASVPAVAMQGGTARTSVSREDEKNARHPAEHRTVTGLLAEFTYQPAMLGNLGTNSVSLSNGFGLSVGLRFFERVQPFVGYVPSMMVAGRTLYNHDGVLWADLYRHPIWLGVGGVFKVHRFRIVPTVSLTVDIASIDINHSGFPPSTVVEAALRNARLTLSTSREGTRIDQSYISMPLFISAYLKIFKGWWATASVGVDILLSSTHLITAYVDGKEVARLSFWPVRPFLQIGFSFRFLAEG